MRGCYLLLFGSRAATVAAVPEQGSLYLLTDGDQGLRAAESADHGEPRARITARDGEHLLEPLGPGSLQVNGLPLGGPWELHTGDEVQIDGCCVVYHGAPRVRSAPQVLVPRELRVRLRQEVERSLRYQRPLSVLVLAVDRSVSREQEAAIAEAVARAVRFVDIVGQVRKGELAVLFPETGEHAGIPAARVMQATTRLGAELRGGLARCPTDGTDPDALVAGARAAAARAAPFGVEPIGGDREAGTLQLGELNVVAVDPKTRRLFELAHKLAQSDIPVLVSGETGVGKELVARALHEWSPRRSAPLISINCAAVPETLLESELFGHERGAFSGADSAKPGLFESAEGGTLFLDEVSECAPGIQAKLLRVLESRRVRRVGATQERAINVRVVAATNRDLEQEIAAGRFRQDLYYRLNVAAAVVPPLRDRVLDIPELTRSMLAEICRRAERAPLSVADDAMERLLAHRWPGNVRELRNVLERCAAVLTGPRLEAADLPDRIGGDAAPWMAARRLRSEKPAPPRSFRKLADEIKELERTRILQALEATGGVRKEAARLIGMPLRTFVTKLKVHGINKDDRRWECGSNSSTATSCAS